MPGHGLCAMPPRASGWFAGCAWSWPGRWPPHMPPHTTSYLLVHTRMRHLAAGRRRSGEEPSSRCGSADSRLHRRMQAMPRAGCGSESATGRVMGGSGTRGLRLAACAEMSGGCVVGRPQRRGVGRGRPGPPRSATAPHPEPPIVAACRDVGSGPVAWRLGDGAGPAAQGPGAADRGQARVGEAPGRRGEDGRGAARVRRLDRRG